MAVKLGRRFIGCELKRSYFDVAVSNLDNAVQAKAEKTLFDVA